MPAFSRSAIIAREVLRLATISTNQVRRFDRCAFHRRAPDRFMILAWVRGDEARGAWLDRSVVYLQPNP